MLPVRYLFHATRKNSLGGLKQPRARGAAKGSADCVGRISPTSDDSFSIDGCHLRQYRQASHQITAVYGLVVKLVKIAWRPS